MNRLTSNPLPDDIRSKLGKEILEVWAGPDAFGFLMLDGRGPVLGYPGNGDVRTLTSWLNRRLPGALQNRLDKPPEGGKLLS